VSSSNEAVVNSSLDNSPLDNSPLGNSSLDNSHVFPSYWLKTVKICLVLAEEVEAGAARTRLW
jgi:hypothetical protein